jgi:glycosyltransferase involved in cell wall biosynthesis
MACGVPVIASDRVGCAADTIDDSCGRVFPWSDMQALTDCIHDITRDAGRLDAMRRAAAKRAWMFDISRTEDALMRCLVEVLPA